MRYSFSGTTLLVLIKFFLSIGCQSDLPPSVVDEIARLPEKIDYNFHVKPILSDKCFACHGPDSKKRKANLRLDFDSKGLEKIDSRSHTLADVHSEMLHRLTTKDPQIKMPPPESHLNLNPHQIAVLVKWMDQGAEYQPHWSFLPLAEPSDFEAVEDSWAQNEIDYFVQQKWKKNKIIPSPKASKTTLIRRLSFTLRGLPPTLEEIDAFLANNSPMAVDQLIDQFLDSPQYGERMAAQWMDVARYADSDGYLDDKHRDFSPWRDWVIHAFNQNMSYQDFVTQQLAGDLIPQANQSSKIATAFNRLHKKNSEAGIIFEEFRAEYVADRTTTFGKAFLGMTLECARCHDHKYDPISQKNFYEISSFFNSTNEIGHAVYGPGQVAGPSLLLTSQEQDTLIRYIQNELNVHKQSLASNAIQKESKFEQWYAQKKGAVRDMLKNLSNGLVAHYTFDEFQRSDASKLYYSPSKLPGQKPARLSEPIIDQRPTEDGFFVGEFTQMTLPEKVGWFDQTDPFTLSFSIFPEHQDQESMVFGHCEQIRLGLKGYSLFINNAKLKFIMARSWPQNAIEVETKEPIPLKKWSQVTVTYDGTGAAEGIEIFTEGQKVAVERMGDVLYKSILFEPDIHTYGFEGFKIGASHKIKAFQNGGFDELKIYNRELTALEVAYLHNAQQNCQDKECYKEFYLKNIEPTHREWSERYRLLRKKLTQIMDPIPELMIMGDAKKYRPTHILNRGNYQDIGEEVFPNTPEVILGYDQDLPKNRLGLSQWLFDPRNPLTARVFVNRIWQMHFGVGLVSSSEDLGNQGRLPSHPRLLDWLSHYFMVNHWDIKKLHKKILSSATYQQDSKIRKDLIDIDPENLLLARGPSFRMSAEMIRDNALAISNLLVKKIGGKSVYPYQPKDLWDLSDKKWKYRYPQEKGEGLYRRSMYTFWKRTAPPPSMLIFDTPNRDLCAVRRTLTSSPLQALVMLNDPQMIEAARVLAQYHILNDGEEAEEQLPLVFRKITGRIITNKELETLKRFYGEEKEKFSQNPQSALSYLKTGEHPLPPKIDITATAALTSVISGIMNTAEAITIN